MWQKQKLIILSTETYTFAAKNQLSDISREPIIHDTN